MASSLGAEVLRLAGFRALAQAGLGWRVVYGAGDGKGAADGAADAERV